MSRKRTTAETQSRAKQPNQAAIFISRGIDFTPRRAEANVCSAGDPARPSAGPGRGREVGCGRWGVVAQVTSLQKGNRLKQERKWMIAAEVVSRRETGCKLVPVY